MRLELENLDSGAVHAVGEDGAVLGREPTKSDIRLEDEAISKRHARLYLRGGTWFVEDLGSSNGTFVYDQRISTPTEVGVGVEITFAQSRFRVRDIRLPGKDEAVSVPPEAPSLARGLGALPQAVFQLPVWALTLLLNPVGFIQRSVEGNRVGLIGPFELAAYGVVAGAGSAGLSVFAGSLVGGAGAMAALSACLPALGIGAAVGGLMAGFAQPVLGLLSRLLGGRATPRQVIHLTLDTLTLAVVSTLPTILAPAFALAPAPFGEVLGVLAAVYLAGLGVFLVHGWAVRLGLHPMFRGVVWAIGAVALVAGGMRALHMMSREASEARLEVPSEPSETKPVETATVSQTPDAGSRPERSPKPKVEPENAPAAEAPSSKPSLPERPAPLWVGKETPFLQSRAKLAAIEKAVDGDPSLVEREDIREDYAELWRVSYEIEERFRRAGRRKALWQREKILAREAAQARYLATRKLVDRIHAALFGGG